MKSISRLTLASTAIYTGISLAAALAFFGVTTLTGDHDWIARGGGAAWIFALAMIILMPLVTPWVKRRMRS